MKVLLSIKPEFAERILNGSKRFEFRKRIHVNEQVRTIVIYATKPVGKVVGEFSIERVHAAAPAVLWGQTKEGSGIPHAFFVDYFHGKPIGYAIEVKKAKRYAQPKDLADVLPSGIAPQSYAYVN